MSVIFLHPDGDIAGRTTMSGSEIRKMLCEAAQVCEPPIWVHIRSPGQKDRSKLTGLP